jgi:quercetin dioxygenase-like cupin family protein
MKVIKLEEVKVESTEGGIFTGAVGIQRITGADALIDSKDLSISIVSFPKGIHNTFHTHDQDQLLWILSGKALLQRRRKRRLQHREWLSSYQQPRDTGMGQQRKATFPTSP